MSHRRATTIDVDPTPPPEDDGSAAADRSWDLYDDEAGSSDAGVGGESHGKNGRGCGGFSLSSLVGIAKLIGDERARVEAERSKTFEALTDALKEAAQRETRVMSEVVDRLREANAKAADAKAADAKDVSSR